MLSLEKHSKFLSVTKNGKSLATQYKGSHLDHFLLSENTITYGFISYDKGEKNEAIQQFQKAISLNEKFADPQLALATIFYQQGEVEKAKQLAKSALKLNPKLADPAYLKENVWGEIIINDIQQMLKALKL